MDKPTVEKYVKGKLANEIREIEATYRKNECLQLTVFEKAIIYKYSDNGYEAINEELRISKGKTFDEFAIYLVEALTKLPDFDGLVYRKVYLNKEELDRYKNALDNDEMLIEYSFISTSKSRLIAMAFDGTDHYKSNCLFRIQTKKGKEIEKIAKFDEREVLILPNTTFKVFDLSIELDYTLITIEEI